MTTYTWTVNSIECLDTNADNSCNTIKSAFWTLTGNNDVNISSVNGKTPLDLVIVPGEGQSDADAFALVTEANVIDAIQHVLGSESVANYKANIDFNLAELAKPVLIIPPLPWA